MRKYIFHITVAVIALIIAQTQAHAQEGTSKLIRRGNAQYKKQQYADAEASYKKALERNNKSVEGNYNLGNSLYEQKRFDAARQQYANTIKSATGKAVKADANYNIGNTFMEDKKWEESIKSYKNALKANPADEQARYNLAYAQAMLKKQNQQGGGKDDKENKDKQKNQKDKKDQDKKDQDKKDQQQNQDEQKDQDKKDQQQPQPKPSKLTPEEAKRLLQNLAQQEKKLQEDKMKKVKGTPGQVEKDW
ncbi:tetratricopeptide repeat protein [Chitinophaga sp. GCM10012297]|uniref:Tetratricopeptide repeat protein n=1 Tax=Chitinophaga chungangae TaxID=2821488 RepID=A0ABS3YDJ6_9BACT|nr:tetratricopeptide repeat protein [Chitinophaga chungangae]MBO9152731.1 tetratricopeptide repeat protein [Chitinophaga chungangae]